MFIEKFFEILNYEGVVFIVICLNNEVYVVNIWNSYLIIVEGNKILIFVVVMIKIEENINVNFKVKLIFGSKEVMGY